MKNRKGRTPKDPVHLPGRVWVKETTRESLETLGSGGVPSCEQEGDYRGAPVTPTHVTDSRATPTHSVTPGVLDRSPWKTGTSDSKEGPIRQTRPVTTKSVDLLGDLTSHRRVTGVLFFCLYPDAPNSSGSLKTLGP